MKRARGCVVIAGGGTAGHVLPGLAVAAELVAGGRAASEIIFVGSRRGHEATLVPEAGYDVVLLPGRGVPRSISLAALRSIVEIVRGVFVAVGTIRRLRPSVVMTLGGYASVPAAVAAVIWRVPIVVTDQNARAGAANRFVGRFARASAVAFEDTDLPRATVCGNPVRQEIRRLAVDPAASRSVARSELEVGDRIMIAVFSGSLGSRRINTAVRDLVIDWQHRGDLVVHHVIGRREAETFVPPALPEPVGDPTGRIAYHCADYTDRMDVILAAADLAVCRAGGSTVAELAVAGVPSILVPLPIAPRDHQRYNAAELVGAGAAVLVDDDDCDAVRLAAEISSMLADPSTLPTMSDAARRLGRPDAARAVAQLVEATAR